MDKEPIGGELINTPTPNTKKVVSITEAARINNVTRQAIYVAIKQKKLKASKGKTKAPEIKSLQVKIGTGENDLELKAKKASEWLKEGHRIKIDLFLPGRSKYLDVSFLKERLERILKLISVEYKSDEPKKAPKGMTVMIEKA